MENDQLGQVEGNRLYFINYEFDLCVNKQMPNEN